MISDALLNLVPPNSPLSLANLAAGAAVTSQTIDLLGSGVGTAPQVIIGTRTVYGQSIGNDWLKPCVVIYIGTAFATSSTSSLNIQFQGSVDSGASGGPAYSPNAWQTYSETGPILATNLAAGRQIIMDVPRNFPPEALPRFLQLNFQTLAATTFTAGTIASATMTMVPPENVSKFAAKNYVVA